MDFATLLAHLEGNQAEFLLASVLAEIVIGWTSG